MKPTIVRLPQLDPKDGRIYSLNWMGSLRRGEKQFEIFTRFVSEPALGKPPTHIDRWIRITDFPFLILGSRWFRGVMVGKPLGLRSIELDSTYIVRKHVLSCQPKAGKLCFGDAYRLAFDSPASPVLELEARDGARILLPLTELYRSHYFCVPRAVASMIGGLISASLNNPNIGAWDPDETLWIDQARRIAQFAPAKFIQRQQALCLARLIFSRSGRRSLLEFHKWIQATFANPTSNGRRSPSQLLPGMYVPYTSGEWKASVVPIDDDEDGYERLLVLHIESFEAHEPYDELRYVDPFPRRADETNGSGQDEASRGEILDPIPPDELDNIDEGWDPNLKPVQIADVITRDDASARRQPKVVRRPPEPQEEPPSAPWPVPAEDIDEGSTQSDGERGSGVGPIVFSYDNPWPKRSSALKRSFEAIGAAMQAAVAKHTKFKISAGAQFLPDGERVYCFAVLASLSAYAISRVKSRQFLIAEVRFGTKTVYVIDPERRLDSDSFPVGIVWRLGNEVQGSRPYAAMDTEHLKEIITELETRLKKGRAWTLLPGLKDSVTAVPVIHPRATAETVVAFSARIERRLIEVAGDERVQNLITDRAYSS